MQFIIPKFVLNKIEMPIRVVNEHEDYYWVDTTERIIRFLLDNQLPYIAQKTLTPQCYGFNENNVYTRLGMPVLYEEWAIEQTERYPKGKLLSVL